MQVIGTTLQSQFLSSSFFPPRVRDLIERERGVGSGERGGRVCLPVLCEHQRSNSGSQACGASTLPTEPIHSTQRLFCFHFLKNLIYIAVLSLYMSV